MKYRYLTEANLMSDDEYSPDEELSRNDSFDDVEDDDIGRLTASELKRKFKDGEINYDSLLKYLMGSDQETDELDDLDDIDDIDGEYDDLDADEDLEDFDQEENVPLRGRSVEQDEQYMRESAPPGEEEWIRKMKPEFVKRYSKRKGMDVLYATAWKRQSAIKEALGDDEEELSPAERALIARSERALKKKAKVDAKFDPDAVKKKPRNEPKAPAKKAAADNDQKKQPEQQKQSDDKPTRGRGKPIGERGGNIRSWFKDNPGATRKEFMAKAADLGMGTKHANTLYYTLKRGVSECYFIGVDGKYLTETSQIKNPKFIQLSEAGELMAFTSKQQAYKIIDLLNAAGTRTYLV